MRKLWKRFRFIFNIRKFIPFLKEFFISKEVPMSKKLISAGLFGLYMVLPLDLIPDFLVFFGILDDVTVFMFVMQYVVKMAPPAMRERYDM
ncbi:DUF1232 domain-containing protein [Ectobacillus antri]|jgi:uncharacterized membrane protein YkvA (DUF1232 family)|uniref:DUF1232 domain-containing protein n=1 Tax=Ectobacillus antri TaxID=2486280 RepID=A0ABT6H4Y8_9BACI|nr:DUF1232 domain-containing protein [Ectobacillus antri]MDG4656779.1 DUF1232 domain-containing protein [Ectobacillus antri]MDG5753858.1 DUF1232 domain-containing protein [Ectobacillus antri]